MRLILGALVVLAVAITATTGRAAADGSPSVEFVPSDTAVAVGETVTVDVTVGKVPNELGLGGYDLVLTYDPTVLRLESLADTGFVAGGDLVVICVTGTIDHQGGSVNANCTPIPLLGAPGVSNADPFPLLNANFLALAPGRSELRLTGELYSPDGSGISAALQVGTVTVHGAAADTPAPTAAAELPLAGSATLPGSGSGMAATTLALTLVSGLLLVVALLLRERTLS